MAACNDCAYKENPPGSVRRCMVRVVYFCTIHACYVEPDEPPCEHGVDDSGEKLIEPSNAHTREENTTK